MSIIEDLHRLDANKAVLGGVFFVGFLAPGFLTVFCLSKDLFLALDPFKLTVLSLAITSPSFVLLFITTLITERVAVALKIIQKGRLGGFKDWFISHSISNATIFYIVILINLLHPISTKYFILWLIALLGVYLINEFIRALYFSKSKDFNPKISDPSKD